MNLILNIYASFIIYFQLCAYGADNLGQFDFSPSVDNFDDYQSNVDDDDVKTCTKLDGITTDHGTIQYFNNDSRINLCWLLQAKEKVYITVKFRYINLPNCYSFECYDFNRCPYNWIKIKAYNEYFYTKASSPSYCGRSQQPDTRAYYANALKVFLKIDRLFYGGRMSFSLQYKIERPHENVVMRSYHFITSLGYPERPPPNTHSSWNVSLSSPSTMPLQLMLNDWLVDSTSVMHVYDGSSTSSPMLHSFSRRSESSIPVYSSGPFMYIEFIVGNEGSSLGSFYTGFNATVKVKGYCLPGFFACGDGDSCYSARQRCDKKLDCASGLDEKGCGNCAADEYWCGTELGSCFKDSDRCDGKASCVNSKADETKCTSCAPGAFMCISTARCIFDRWRCDGQSDCKYDEDELNCTYKPSRRVITAAIVGSLVCGLLLAVALGCICKLYTLRHAARSRSRRNRLMQTTPLGRIARELLQQEAPPSYSMAVDGVEHSERSHRSSRRRRDRRRRRRSREPRIRRAQALPRAQVEGQVTNREDTFPTESRRSSSSANPTHDVERASTSQTTPAEQRAINVALVLAEMGLADFPPETHAEETQQRNQAAEQNAAGTSTSSANVETQAPPLPKKQQIRPVMVEAPFDTVLVDDIPSCVYPNPPSYDEATVSGVQPVPASPDPAEEQSNVEHREVSGKIWSKKNPRKIKDFLKFPSFQDIFNVGHARSGFHELRETAENVHLNDDQIQLISDFASEESDQRSAATESSEICGSTSGSVGSASEADNQLLNSQPHTNGSFEMELQSYSTAASATGPNSTTPPVNFAPSPTTDGQTKTDESQSVIEA